MQTVVHITPQIPPAICGVGDYAAVVGRRMEELCAGVRCGYLAAGHRAGDAGADEAIDRTRRLRSLGGECDRAALWKAVEELAEDPSSSPSLGGREIGEAAIVLHYSGYGYDPSGAPAWLAEALERRPAHLAGVRVVTFFHELYATSKPWQRAFWTSGRQRAEAIRAARASDALATNREQSARWLEREAGLPAGCVPHLPICSNVGEPTKLVPWEERPRRAVTFGAAAFKRFALWDDAERVAAMLERLAIDELVDIGESTPIATKVFARHGVRVEVKGRQPAAAVSEILGGSRVGLLDYNPDYMDKSGVQAAFLAHGVACIMPRRPTTESPGFVSLVDVSVPILERVQRSAALAAELYAVRSVRRHAEMLLGSAGIRATGVQLAKAARG